MYLAQPEQQTLQPFLTPQALKALSTELGFWYLCLHTFFLSCMAYWKVSIILCWSIFFLNVWTTRLGSDERHSTSDLYRQGNFRYCRASSMFLIITQLIVLVLGLLKWRGINHVCWCTFSSEVNIFTILVRAVTCLRCTFIIPTSSFHSEVTCMVELEGVLPCMTRAQGVPHHSLLLLRTPSHRSFPGLYTKLDFNLHINWLVYQVLMYFVLTRHSNFLHEIHIITYLGSALLCTTNDHKEDRKFDIFMGIFLFSLFAYEANLNNKCSYVNYKTYYLIIWNFCRQRVVMTKNI